MTSCLHLVIFFNKNLTVFEVYDIPTYNRNYKATKQQISPLSSSNIPSLCSRECFDVWSALAGNIQTPQCIAKKQNGIFNPYLLQLVYPRIRKCVIPSISIQPYHSHSRRENETPSSGTSPLACCKDVIRFPHPRFLPASGRVNTCLLYLYNSPLSPDFAP